MPAYITRGPDASISITVASTKLTASAVFDDIAECSPADVHLLPACTLHLRLNDRGQFVLVLDAFEDGTDESILALFPHLAQAYGDDDDRDLTAPEMAARWLAAVRQELADARQIPPES